MQLIRERPHWHMLCFHYGLGLVVLWQLLEDIVMGQWKVYTGAFYPWRQYVDTAAIFGPHFYWVLAGAEFVLLFLYFRRRCLRVVCALLATMMLIDGLASFLNHRFLMALELLLMSLCPLVPNADESGYRGKHHYWNLDLLRWQLSLVYLITAIHKMNPHFLSGEALYNIFWTMDHHGLRFYPDWLLKFLLNRDFCYAMAWMTVACEFSFAFTLNFRRTVGWTFLFALGMHLSIGLLMAFIWIFTTQVFFTLIAFVPDRTTDGTYQLSRRGDAHGPRRLLRLCIPGYVEEHVDADQEATWMLRTPAGETMTGYEAWLQVMALSPLTFMLAEILRIAPVRMVGERLLK